MVLFINLFGNAFNLPKNICPYCHDINQDIANHLNISDSEAFDINREKFSQIDINNQVKHNALWDALVIKKCFERLNS